MSSRAPQAPSISASPGEPEASDSGAAGGDAADSASDGDATDGGASDGDATQGGATDDSGEKPQARTPPSRLVRWRVPLLLFATALLLRLAYNLWVHPPEEAIFSDMSAYVVHAKRLVAHPGKVFADDTFFPIGTHLLLAMSLALFGKQGLAVASWLYALMSALIVPAVYGMTGQLIAGPVWQQHDAPKDRSLIVARRWALGTGILAILYYPLISYSGFFLSEGPFALCLSVAALMSLRVMDNGRSRDAWLLGLALGAGYLVRPQILAALGLLAALVLLRRKLFKHIRLGLIARALLPLAIAMGFMATYAHVRAGGVRLLPSNGAVNRVLARCHVVEVHIPVARMAWSPPPLRSLQKWEKKHPERMLLLDAAGDYRVDMFSPPWEPEAYNDLASLCVERTGLLRQARYAATHVAMLWAGTAWPASSSLTSRSIMRWSARIHFVVLVPPLLWALFVGLGRKRARVGVVAIYVWSVLVTAALYFGSGRLRTPYDGIILALAIYGYATLVTFIRRKWRERKQRKLAA